MFTQTLQRRMNTRFMTIFILSALVALMTSCSSKPDSLSSIPKDAYMVSVVNFKSLAMKGELDKLSERKMVKMMQREARSESKEMSEIMENLLKDPSVTGINFKDDGFIYMVNHSDKDQFTCFTVSLSSGEDFQAFLEDVLSKSDTKYDINKGDAYNYITMDKTAIGWDDKKATFVAAVNYSSRKRIEPEIEDLMTLKSSDAISTVDEFNDFYKNRKDLSFWFSADMLSQSREYRQMLNMLNFDLKGTHFYACLDFGNDEITVQTKLQPGEELKELMKKNDLLDNDFDADLLKNFPAKSFATASVSVNTDGYYNYMKSMMKDAKEFEEAEKGFKEETGLEMKEVFEGLGGSMLFSLYDFKSIESKEMRYDYETGEIVEEPVSRLMPMMGLALDLEEDDWFETIVDLFSKQGMLQKAGDYYIIPAGNMPFFLAYNKDQCFVTNDEEAAKRFTGDGSLDSDLSDSDIKGNITGNPGYVYLNLNYDDYPQKMKDEYGLERQEEPRAMLKIWNKWVNKLEVKSVDDYTSEAVFAFKESDGNSLNTILTIIDDNYRTFESW